MIELIKKVKAGGHRTICMATPPDILPDLPDSDWEIFATQQFIWYTDFVAFKARGDIGSYLIEVYLSDKLNTQADISHAILLPFTVPPEGTLLVTGSYGDPSFPFQLPPGNYKMLFETRFLTDQEIASSGHYDYLLEKLENPDVEFWDELRPELCIFTFIATTDSVNPRVLKGFRPQQQLILHDKSRPAGFD